MTDWIGKTDLGILNENQPARLTDSSSTVPDLSIALSNCLPACTWAASTALGSDHLPIHINMSTEIKRTPAPNKTFVNFKKADWASFKAQTENAFSNATTNNNVHAREKIFRNIINKASKQHIPAGRIPNILNAMPTKTAKLMEDRDQIRRADPADLRLKDLNDEIHKQKIIDRRSGLNT